MKLQLAVLKIKNVTSQKSKDLPYDDSELSPSLLLININLNMAAKYCFSYEDPCIT